MKFVMARMALFTLLLALLAGCEKSSTDSNGGNNGSDTTVVVTETIGPAGGTIDFGDGTTLTIPAGALSSETDVSISKVTNAEGIGSQSFEFIGLEPSGTNLSSAATLRIPYQEYQDFDENLLAVYTFNETTNEWELMTILNQNTTDNYVEVAIPHFSWFVSIFDRPLDLVLDIPGEYLRKSDLIYALAQVPHFGDEFHWFPGHVGLYLGASNGAATTNDGSTIIESAPPDGVHFEEFDNFKYSSVHLYMGARRYNGTLSDDDRSTIATYAIDKEGAGYLLIGQGNFSESGYSCVGLTEASYDDADKSNVPALLEYPFILPLEQYIRTVPVDDITVFSNAEVYIPVWGVVWDAETTEYTRDASRFTAAATNLPAGASFVNNAFEWIPSQSQVGQNYTVNFQVEALSGGISYTRNQNLIFHVEQGLAANSVIVNSNPSGASIYLDGTNMGLTTPATLTPVSAGPHQIRLYKAGYNEYIEDFTLPSGGSYTVNAVLETPTPPLPVFTIAAPSNGEHFSDNVITVSGLIQLQDSGGILTPFTGDHAILTLNGVDQVIPVFSGQFSVDVSIAGGANTIRLRANSEAGDTGISDQLTVYGDFTAAAIEVTLTWNTPTCDLDLHIWNPAGEHCYYGHMNISDGSLDIDDTEGFGPETFTVPTASDGAYVVKINDYDLDEDAYSDGTVQVSLGGGSPQTFGPHHFTVADYNGSNPEAWWEVTVINMFGGMISYQVANVPAWMAEKIQEDMKNLPRKD